MSDFRLNINVTDTEENIILEGIDENKTVWDEDGISFFASNFPNTPIWYNKRVAYGVAEHGEYVDLTTEGSWERPPNIHLSINNFPTFIKNYEWNGQEIEVVANNITTSGFDVIAKLNALSSQRDYDYDPIPYVEADTNESDEMWCPATNNNCNRVKVNGRAKLEVDFGAGIIEGIATVELYKYNESNEIWEHYSQIYSRKEGDEEFDDFYTADSGIITAGKYRPEITVETNLMMGDPGGTTKNWAYDVVEYYDDKDSIATGEVNWIAVESSE